MKLAGNSVRGRVTADAIEVTCDDCGTTYTFHREPQTTTVKVDTRAWSITKRKQRCPDCTVIARRKGWVA